MAESSTYTNVYRLEMFGGCSFSVFVWFVLGVYNPDKPTHKSVFTMIAPSSFHHVRTASITSEFFFLFDTSEKVLPSDIQSELECEMFLKHTAFKFSVRRQSSGKNSFRTSCIVRCYMRKCFWLNGTNVIIFVCFQKLCYQIMI